MKQQTKKAGKMKDETAKPIDLSKTAVKKGAGKPSRFATESEAGAAVEAPPVSNTVLALFAARPVGMLDTLKRRNLPQMIKAVDGDRQNIPLGGIVAGIIVDVCKSPVSTVKGSLLWLHIVSFDDKGNPVKTGTEITFPATGVIRNALAPGVEGEDNCRKVMLQLKGHLLVAQRQENKPNKKYGKEMTMWDVRTSEKPVDIGVKIN